MGPRTISSDGDPHFSHVFAAKTRSTEEWLTARTRESPLHL